jgi:O-acetyl-ADP-ribose deacetylase (regulator of RNase III)
LGSGLGGLDWSDVRPLIHDSLSVLTDVDITVYEPGGVPADLKGNRSKAVPRLTAGRAALVGLMNRYLAGLMDPYVSLLEVHKLMYFLQVADERLRLRYVKGPYGPYAENLRHVLREIEGHLISGFSDGGEDPAKELSILPGAVADAERFLKEHGTTLGRFERVTRLVEGFETPFGLELLSTVHWVVSQEDAVADDAIERATYAWNDRKRQFSPGQLRLAAERLRSEGWVGSPTVQA